jgi:transcriptional regulator with XRE-family HTH domain
LPRKPSFGRHLRDARIERGLSVTEVAEQVGVSVQSIYFWENDHVRPRDANLSALQGAEPVRATRERVRLDSQTQLRSLLLFDHLPVNFMLYGPLYRGP